MTILYTENSVLSTLFSVHFYYLILYCFFLGAMSDFVTGFCEKILKLFSVTFAHVLLLMQ